MQQNEKQNSSSSSSSSGLTLGLFFIIITLVLLQLLIFGLTWTGLSVEERSSEDSTTKQNYLYFATIGSCFSSAILALIIGFMVKRNNDYPEKDSSSTYFSTSFKEQLDYDGGSNNEDYVTERSSRMPGANKSSLDFTKSTRL